MADFEVTAPSGQKFMVSAPEGASHEQVISYAKDQFSKRDMPDGVAPPAPIDTRSALQRFDDRMKGATEAGLTIASGATSGLLGRLGGTIGGIAGSIATGKYGTQEGAGEAALSAEQGAQRLTIQPQTQEGRDALESVSRLFDRSKLAGLGPSEAVLLNNLSGTAQSVRQVGRTLRAGAEDVRDTAGSVARRVFAKDIQDEPLPSEMVGVGAAETDQAALRRARAAELPVPIKLTKGQADRSFEQQQFERETAKNPKLGEPLRQRFSEQNEKILQNFDSWLDQTGAEAGSLRSTGEIVSNVIAKKAQRAKSEINAAYTMARDSGQMSERVDIGPLRSYLDEHQAEAINAPVLTSAEAKLERIAKDGTATINDLEEVRKMVGRLSGKDATNALFGREVKGVIDEMTDGKGGDLYKRARSLRFNYGKEFEDHAVVDRLLSFKPGTKDRSVAYEDVFSHSILKGSRDDVATMRRTLQTSGPEGMQAWRELQGATIQHLKDEITKNVQIDSSGNRVISPARLDRLVTELDKDGKLDLVFGKQGAQQIRNINSIAQDAFTAPPGSVNSSNTASALLSALDRIASKTTGVPFVGSATAFAAKEIKAAKTRQQVQKALE